MLLFSFEYVVNNLLFLEPFCGPENPDFYGSGHPAES